MVRLSWERDDGAVLGLFFVDQETNELHPQKYGVVELSCVGHFPFYFPENGIILLSWCDITGNLRDAIRACRRHTGYAGKLDDVYGDYSFRETAIEWAAYRELVYVAFEVNGHAAAFVCQGSRFDVLPAGQRTQPVDIFHLESAKRLCEQDVVEE